MNINVSNNIDLVGSLIANKRFDGTDGGNLLLNANSLTFSNILDKDKARSYSFGAGVGSNNKNNSPNSGNFSFGYSSKDIKQITKATIGNGTINITNNSDITGLNRNIKNSQEIIKNQVVGEVSGKLLFFSKAQKQQQDYNPDGSQKTFEQKVRQWLRPDKTILSSVSSAANIHDNSNLKSSILTLQDYINKSGGDYFEDGTIKVSKLSLQGGQIILETADKVTTPLKKIPLVGDVFYHVSPIEQLAHTFVEKDSKLYFTNVKTGEIRIVDKADLAKNYAVNGIQTDLNKLVKNYLNNNPELVVRHNPTHGMVGDLLESSLGKITNILDIPQVIAMNRYVGQDLFDRKDIKSYINPVTGDRETPINLFHSQGTIIGQSAMILYKNKYMSNEQDSLSNQINKSQIFAAVGPAVSKQSWKDYEISIGLIFDDSHYRHDNLDPVRYLTAPSNATNQVTILLGADKDYNSSIYLPNILEPIYGVGLGISDGLNLMSGGYFYKIIGKDLPNIEHHDVKNPYYQKAFELQ